MKCDYCGKEDIEKEGFEEEILTGKHRCLTCSLKEILGGKLEEKQTIITKPEMKCPFCNNKLNLIPVKHYNKNEEEYTLGCENCEAIGAIYRKKSRNTWN